MDVDPPSLNCSNLKRSSSAPMINVLTANSSREIPLPTSPLLLSIPRTRRFSASFSPNHSPHSPTASLSPVVPSRVIQIKHEEGMDVMFRETAHEKEVQSKIQMSQSWEDLTLDDPSLGETSKRPRSLTDPLHVFTPPPGLCNSPSPTRTGKQCFSPSTCLPVRSSAFSPSPSPSPTRKNFTTRRSQSPISLRPSQFSMKRKYDMEIDQMDTFPNPSKRLNTGMSTPPEHMSPVVHPLINSLSSSVLEASSSPDQTVPQEGADITDLMSSCSGSPCNIFKPLDPAPSNQDSTCMEETAV